MQQKYDWPDKIPDEEIKKQFALCTEVQFSARRFNHIPYRSISFGDLGWWLPLTRVLPLIGVTPQTLRPLFNPQHMLCSRRFPFNLRWFGLNKRCSKVVTIELPHTIETYEELGSFSLSTESFVKFAQILGRSVEVLREDGGTGDHYFCFIAHPSGEVTRTE